MPVRSTFVLLSAVSPPAHVVSALPWVNRLPARLHAPIFGGFLLLTAADALRRWLGYAWPLGWEALSPGVWAMAALTLAVGLARRLPGQNVFAVVLLAAGLGFALEALNGLTNLPFGRRSVTVLVEPRILGVAWFLPSFWVTLAISGRGVGRLILRPWRKLRYYGLWVMAVATGLSLGLVVAAEPFATRSGWWWRETPADVWDWYGTPVASVMGWLLTTLIIYGFTTPWFLNKQPVKQPTDWHPLLVWLILLLWLSLGNALGGAWWAVAAGGVCAIGAIILAVRGGSW